MDSPFKAPAVDANPTAGAGLSTAQAARLLGVSQATMRWRRHRGTGPRWTRTATGRARYLLADLEKWVAGEPTEDAAVLARVSGLLELTTPGENPVVDAARHVAATEKKG
jgi:hypothetical protein